MSLPNPGMVFVPFDILTAQEMNDLAENIEALAAGTGFNAGAINSGDIDFTTTGKVWWEEIGRTKLTTSSDTITVASLPNRRYLHLIISAIAFGGSLEPSMIFNGDNSTNYTVRYSYNFSAGSSIGSQGSIGITGAGVPAGQLMQTIADIVNIASSPKSVHIESIDTGVAGAPNGINVLEMYAKWVNTSNPISTITMSNGGTGDFAVGSEVIVLGHN